MADTFEDLGLAPELVAAVEPMGWDAPAGLQRDAVPVIRRGNNAVLHASKGAGALGAYALAALDRLIREAEDDPDATTEGIQMLVLTPEATSASRTADSLARLAGLTGISVRATSRGWPDQEADVLVTTAPTAISGVRESALKLDGVRVLVIDGADRFDTEHWEAIQTLTAAVPAAAQRVVVTGAFGSTVDDYLEGHVRRALTIPPRSTEGGPAASSAEIRYTVVPDYERASAVVHLLGKVEPRADTVAVICRNPDRAEELEEALTARRAGGLGGDSDAAEEGPQVIVLPRVEADTRSTTAAVISYDVPFDAQELSALHATGGGVVVTPRELAHLKRIAARAGLSVVAEPLPAEAPGSLLESARERIRQALDTDDLAAELALIEPLLDEFSGAEIAAAALRLARASISEQQTVQPTGRPAPEQSPRNAMAASAPAPPPSTSWVRLFVSAGSRDGLGPGDLVGAITGETTLSGDAVGKIEIRESHSTVEVPGSAADAVIGALNGRSLRGRSLRVDYDRQDRTSSGGGQRSGGGHGGQASRPGGAPPNRGGGSGGRGGRTPRGGGGRPGGRPGGGPGGRPGGRSSGGPDRRGRRGGAGPRDD